MKPPDEFESAQSVVERRSGVMADAQRWWMAPTCAKVGAMANEIHVIPNGDEWEVTREGDADPIASYATQEEAIDFGRDQARNDQVEFVIHGADGAIREKDSHGNDPRDIPG